MLPILLIDFNICSLCAACSASAWMEEATSPYFKENFLRFFDVENARLSLNFCFALLPFFLVVVVVVVVGGGGGVVVVRSAPLLDRSGLGAVSIFFELLLMRTW